MAKIYGLFGAMSGKVADVVMSVRNGEQIVRKYQPVVANPKTQNQFSTRARFKLISQLAAVLAPYIAIPRVQGVSSRNRFSSLNFPFSSFNLSTLTAEISLSDVQLTKSTVGLVELVAERRESNISVRLARTPGAEDISRIVYIALNRLPDGKLRVFESVVATTAGVQNDWPATMSLSQLDTYIYAYGVRDNTESARLCFGNLNVLQASQIANLIVSRTLTEQDVTLTETVSFYLPTTLSRSEEEVETKKKAKSA